MTIKPTARIPSHRYPRRPDVPFLRIEIGIEGNPRVIIFADSAADELALRRWIGQTAPDLRAYLLRLAEERA